MIYLDSCALVKFVIPEVESAALVDWVQERDDVLMSSRLVIVELHRALHRVKADQATRDQLAGLIDGLYLRPIDSVATAAASLDGQHLRSLDAIHLATALGAGSQIFVTYDQRLGEHAQDAGLEVAAPA